MLTVKKTHIKNPYIPDLKFDYDINLNLPEYDNLKFVGGTKIIDRIGYKGVIILILTEAIYT